jgi:hypothetical protein
MAKKISYSFKKGTEKVAYENYAAANKELMEYLDCCTIQYYYRKRNSIINLPAHVKEGIEKILGKYGVAPEDVWTIKEINDGDNRETD